MKLPFLVKKEKFRPGKLPPLPGETKRVKIKEEKIGGRKAIIGFFIGTIFISSLFWFWGNLRQKNEEEIIKVLPETTFSSPDRKKSKDEVVDKVLEKVRHLQGEYGFYVYNLVGRYEYGSSEKKTFQAASLIKLPVVLALYQEAEAGRISLEEVYKLKNEDKQAGAGSLQAKPVGTILTYRELAQLMCRDSDNTAFNVVVKKLGEEKIQKTIKSLGMENTSFEKNQTTPYDIGLFFRKLYTGYVVSRKSRDEIIDFLTNTSFEDRIPAGVPAGIKVAHKIGTETGSFSDAGIIFSSKPFILVVMSENASRSQAVSAISAITTVVFEEER